MNPIITHAAAYLTRQIQPSGQFNYLYNPVADTVDNNSYNYIRHAGTLYALYQVGSDLKAIELANQFADKHLKGCLIVETGFIALHLLALIERAKIGWLPEIQFQSYGDVLIHPKWQKPNGDFYHSQEKLGRRCIEKDIMYFAGQAILALGKLYQATRHQPYLDAAIKGADYILTRDADKTAEAIGPDHWLAMALSNLYTITRQPQYRLHAEKIAEGIIASSTVQHINRPALNGNFSIGQIATRVEGLAAVAQMPGYSHIQTACQANVTALLNFCKTLQYMPGNMHHATNPAAATGGFMTSLSQPPIRIDGVQHAISAFIEGEKIKTAIT